MKTNAVPLIVGGAMGVMMLWMGHGALSGGGAPMMALILFAAAHLGLAAVVVLGAVFAARLSPRMQAWMARVHRPSLRHLGLMGASAITSAILVHLFIHGGMV